MTWRRIETNRTARICQVGSLLLILGMVLGILAQDVMRSSSTATVQGDPTRLVAAP
jgi:hypothetical protein